MSKIITILKEIGRTIRWNWVAIFGGEVERTVHMKYTFTRPLIWDRDVVTDKCVRHMVENNLPDGQEYLLTNYNGGALIVIQHRNTGEKVGCHDTTQLCRQIID